MSSFNKKLSDVDSMDLKQKILNDDDNDWGIEQGAIKWRKQLQQVFKNFQDLKFIILSESLMQPFLHSPFESSETHAHYKLL